MQEHRGRRATKLSAEEAFGQVLREIRKGRGMSQEELAFKSGYHPTYIGQLERGLKSPSLRTIMCLAGTLNTLGSNFLLRVEKLVSSH